MNSLATRIFKSIFITVMAIVLVLNLAVGWLAYLLLDKHLQQELQNVVSSISLVANSGDETTFEAYLDDISLQDVRLTWISPEGTVLYDSTISKTANADQKAAKLREMDNHIDRPEVIDALDNGAGTAKRYSDTLNEETIYLAKVLNDGTILRASGTQQSVLGHLGSMIVPDLLIIALVIAITLVVAHRTARRILRPFSQINFAEPLESDTYPELSPLLTRLNGAMGELDEQSRALRAQKHEFDIVTDNMKEGLILIDSQGAVLSINAAAAEIFNLSDVTIATTLSEQRHLLSISRKPELRLLLDAVLSGSYAENELERDGRYYQLLGSPVIAAEHEGGSSSDSGSMVQGSHDEGGIQSIKPDGAVLLIRDITEWRESDVMRKQFSANVSHELKTPLTVINGYAELMKQGMVNPGDEVRLASLIHEESTRMILMIDDILTVSQLDESNSSKDALEQSFEPLDLFQVSGEVMQQLQTFADEKRVTLSGPLFAGEHDVDDLPSFRTKGVRTLVTRMIYNLVENGIRYSDPGGDVSVCLDVEDDERLAVSVADTGIGIPLSLQDKVFERFFCVDQSRSKATGGTGLGLAIVKNGARLHKATIELSSTEGRGTTITLRFLPYAE